MGLGTLFPVDGVTLLMMIGRRGIMVALLVVTSCSATKSSPPAADASTGPVFQQTNIGEVGCPAALDEAKCWEIDFANHGTPGDGYCDLRQRGRSYVQVIKGAGKHIEFEAAPSGILTTRSRSPSGRVGGTASSSRPSTASRDGASRSA
jgi:hypothetical protein